VVGDAKLVERWTATSGMPSEYDRVCGALSGPAGLIPIEASGNGRAVFVDTEGGGPAFLAASEDGASIVVAVTTSAETAPTAGDVARYAKLARPHGEPLGSLDVESALVAFESSFSGREISQRKFGTDDLAAQLARTEPPAGNFPDTSGAPSSLVSSGAYLRQARGRYSVTFAEGIEINGNTFTVVSFTQRGESPRA
jgi:hypothetical protein